MRTILAAGVVLLAAALVGCSDSAGPAPTTPASNAPSNSADPSVLPQTPTTVDKYVQAIRPHMTIPAYSVELRPCSAATDADCATTLAAASTEISALGADLDATQHIGRAPDEVMPIFLELAEACLSAEQPIADADTDWPGAVQAVQAVTDALDKWRPYGA